MCDSLWWRPGQTKVCLLCVTLPHCMQYKTHTLRLGYFLLFCPNLVFLLCAHLLAILWETLCLITVFPPGMPFFHCLPERAIYFREFSSGAISFGRFFPDPPGKVQLQHKLNFSVGAGCVKVACWQTSVCMSVCVHVGGRVQSRSAWTKNFVDSNTSKFMQKWNEKV